MMNKSVKDRWKNPRDTIAQKFKDNDYGYVLHAGKLFLEFLSASDLKFSELKKLKILDYGCGTARVSRFLSMTGAWVESYDPTPECIEIAHEETHKANLSSANPKKITNNLEELSKEFDLIICINVLEHLTPLELDHAMNNIKNLLKEGGKCYLWVDKHNKHLTFSNKEEYDLLNRNSKVIIAEGQKINGELSMLIIRSN